jgi:hypothetical protein
VRADLDDRDAAYIRRIIAIQRGMEVAGRLVLFRSRFAPALVGGTALLTLSKILENMAIGHNVMHGQWDWMGHPLINSTTCLSSHPASSAAPVPNFTGVASIVKIVSCSEAMPHLCWADRLYGYLPGFASAQDAGVPQRVIPGLGPHAQPVWALADGDRRAQQARAGIDRVHDRVIAPAQP